MILTLPEELNRVKNMRQDIDDLQADIKKTMSGVKEQYCPFVLGQQYAYVKQTYNWQEPKDCVMTITSINIRESNHGDLEWVLRGKLHRKVGSVGKLTGYCNVKIEATDADS